MALVFPTNPTNGEVYQDYIFNTATNAWNRISPAVDIQEQIDTIDAKFPVSLISNVGGTLPVVNGGTGATTVAGAQNALKIGLVTVSPTSVDKTGGTVTVSGLGEVMFSGVTALSLNGVFSSSFRNYRVVFTFENAGASVDVLGQMRKAGVDLGTGYYEEGVVSIGGSVAGLNRINGGAWILGTSPGGGSIAAFSSDIFAPFLTYHTKVVTTSIGWTGSTNKSLFLSGWEASSMSFDGMTFTLAGGASFTGSVQVFGYNND